MFSEPDNDIYFLSFKSSISGNFILGCSLLKSARVCLPTYINKLLCWSMYPNIVLYPRGAGAVILMLLELLINRLINFFASISLHLPSGILISSGLIKPNSSILLYKAFFHFLLAPRPNKMSGTSCGGVLPGGMCCGGYLTGSLMRAASNSWNDFGCLPPPTGVLTFFGLGLFAVAISCVNRKVVDSATGLPSGCSLYASARA